MLPHAQNQTKPNQNPPLIIRENINNTQKTFYVLDNKQLLNSDGVADGLGEGELIIPERF